MKHISVIVICFLVGFVVYIKFESDNMYYDRIYSKDRNNLTIAERGLMAIEREHDLEIRKEEAVLRDYENGKISLEEYENYLQRKLEEENKENEDALEFIGNLYDPEKGMFSGAYKMAMSPKFKKEKQIKELDKTINNLIQDLENENKEIIVIKLKQTTWVPVGDKEIDQEMTKFYEKKIKVILDNL